MSDDFKRFDDDFRPDKRQGGNGNGKDTPPRPNYLPVIIILSLFALIFFVRSPLLMDSGYTMLTISKFQDQYDRDNISKITIEGNEIMRGEFYEKVEEKDKFQVKINEHFIKDNLPMWQARYRADTETRPDGSVWGKAIDVEVDYPSRFVTLLMSLIPYLLIFGLFWFLLFRQFRSPSGGGGILSFGRSKATVTKEDTGVTFNDVAGIDEAKEEVQEIVQFLKYPEKFKSVGAHIPHGVLLIGMPGTGKTLLAKAIAGEAGVPFYSISGSDFVEMFVGVGASRVRDLFKRAKESSPCIIFLDEIDAVGRRRGSGYGGGNDEREQTLNAILVEMDGFDSNESVIVISATNRPDVLDPALRRPGRFDREITVDLPDLEGREEILRVHASKVTLDPEVDLRKIARGTPTYSGAELANLINEAALLAAIRNRTTVSMSELEESRDKVRWGRQKKSRVMTEEDQSVTAYHEAGHAIMTILHKDVDPLHKVSIIPRGMALGSTMSLPERDAYSQSKNKLLSMIKVLYGGRVSEELFCGDITSGAQNDIERATHIARLMVTDWGMSDTIGPIHYKPDGEGVPAWAGGQSEGYHLSQDMSEKIDAEVQSILMHCYTETQRMLTERKAVTEGVALALMHFETLTAKDVHAIVDGADWKTIKPEPEKRALRTPEEFAEQQREKAEQKKKDVVSRSDDIEDNVQLHPRPMDA